MKLLTLILFFIYLPFQSFGQLTKEFEREDSLNEYKDIKFGISPSKAKLKMTLSYVKKSSGYQYSILDKKHLTIGSFFFQKGDAWFLFDRLNFISLESNRTDSKYFQELLDYLIISLGQPLKTNKGYYWEGVNIVYSLTRNTVTNYIGLGISGTSEQ